MYLFTIMMFTSYNIASATISWDPQYNSREDRPQSAQEVDSQVDNNGSTLFFNENITSRGQLSPADTNLITKKKNSMNKHGCSQLNKPSTIFRPLYYNNSLHHYSFKKFAFPYAAKNKAYGPYYTPLINSQKDSQEESLELSPFTSNSDNNSADPPFDTQENHRLPSNEITLGKYIFSGTAKYAYEDNSFQQTSANFPQENNLGVSNNIKKFNSMIHPKDNSFKTSNELDFKDSDIKNDHIEGNIDINQPNFYKSNIYYSDSFRANHPVIKSSSKSNPNNRFDSNIWKASPKSWNERPSLFQSQHGVSQKTGDGASQAANVLGKNNFVNIEEKANNSKEDDSKRYQYPQPATERGNEINKVPECQSSFETQNNFGNKQNQKFNTTNDGLQDMKKNLFSDHPTKSSLKESIRKMFFSKFHEDALHRGNKTNPLNEQSKIAANLQNKLEQSNVTRQNSNVKENFLNKIPSYFRPKYIASPYQIEPNQFNKQDVDDDVLKGGNMNYLSERQEKLNRIDYLEQNLTGLKSNVKNHKFNGDNYFPLKENKLNDEGQMMNLNDVRDNAENYLKLKQFKRSSQSLKRKKLFRNRAKIDYLNTERLYVKPKSPLRHDPFPNEYKLLDIKSPEVEVVHDGLKDNSKDLTENHSGKSTAFYKGNNLEEHKESKTSQKIVDKLNSGDYDSEDASDIVTHKPIKWATHDAVHNNSHVANFHKNKSDYQDDCLEEEEVVETVTKWPGGLTIPEQQETRHVCNSQGMEDLQEDDYEDSNDMGSSPPVKFDKHIKSKLRGDLHFRYSPAEMILDDIENLSKMDDIGEINPGDNGEDEASPEYLGSNFRKYPLRKTGHAKRYKLIHKYKKKDNNKFFHDNG